MSFLPHELEPFRDQAENYLHEGAIQAVEFSGRTYQINVHDKEANESYWSFLHLDESGGIADSFCLCSEENESSHCVHLATSFLKIYHHSSEPLHLRYEKSFFRALFLNIDERLGSNVKALKKEKIFSIKALNKKGEHFISDLAQKGIPPTEENSLKFSDLSEEELDQIRQGDISPKLHYEFSFWSDLAKALLLKQENNEAVEVTFKGDPYPLNLKIKNSDFEIQYHLTEKELASLIPKINQIDSNLKLIGDFKSQVEKVTFDPNTQTFHIELKENKVKSDAPSFHGYQYKKNEGFISSYALPLLEPTVKETEAFLERYQNDLKSYLTIDKKLKRLQTDVELEKGSLKLTPYLNEPGDLKTDSSLIGNWIYHKGHFTKLIDPPKNLSTRIIPRNKVYDYVMTHQAFLNGIEGFHVHLQSLEAVLNYEVDSHYSLKITSKLKSDNKQLEEFGSLVYLKDQGFFLKSSFETNLPLNTLIPSAKVSQFIRSNEKDLKLIPGFFVEHPALKQSTLILKAETNGISVRPHYEWEEHFKYAEHHFFDDYLYIKGHGFSPITSRHFIPLFFREPVVIHEEEYAHFFDKTLKSLEPFIEGSDPKLIPIKKIHLSFKSLVWDEEHKCYIGNLTINDSFAIPEKIKRFNFTPIGMIDFDRSPLKDLILDPAKNRPYYSSLDLLKLITLYDLEINHPILKELSELKSPIPLHHETLKSTLRPYQEIGVQWLWFLYTHRLSGLLCDDMGLGKTHQAMGLISAIKNEHPKAKYLVVCPTSVLHHWEDKLKTFFPSLKIFTFHGIKREINPNADLIITSYGILRNDIEIFKNISFELAVFDEIQLAKNHLSRINNSLKQLKATTRIGLTGTPLENRLRELKSLFDLVLPGLMPTESKFLEQYIKPIERNENVEAKGDLNRLIKPFLLRRKKEEVLTDLPEKMEEISHTDLTAEQRELYNDAIANAQNSIIKDLYDDHKLIPYIHIFALLSSLKKICNHPALFLKNPLDYQKHSSGKWDLFKDLIEEAIASDQKVVVFSHFLGMLDIIEAYLSSEGIGFASLRGATVNRKEEIQRFQIDPSCRVFVASLQAGGLGIDLTKASVVIHYDRWWNAAREDQATDRVHRIGQTRGVQVFKLVTLNTLEERIHEMIEKKKRRMEEIVGADDSQIIKTLTREELIELLRN